jgi:RimJ/RimL family protein N-acetyltransferase
MLKGKEVALRPVEQADLGLLTSWWNDAAFRDAPASHWPIRPQEMERRIAKKPNYSKSGEFMIVLTETLRGSNEVRVGHIAFFELIKIVVCRCFDIGFSVHPDHQRKGYATQAGRLLIDKLFNSRPIHRIQAHCRVSNTASQRVLEKLGMTREGTLRGFARAGGKYEDASLYSILRPEWGSTESYTKRFGGL